MGKHKRGSRALKRYWNDVRAIRKADNRTTKETREAYKRSLKETGFKRSELNRTELVQVIRDFISKFPQAAVETRLGDTIFMSLDGWMKRAVRVGFEMRFELKFYEVKSVISISEAESMTIRADIRRDGDVFFANDPDLGADSFYWRIQLPFGVYTDNKSYYRFVWPDAGARQIVKEKQQAIRDVLEIIDGKKEEKEETNAEGEGGKSKPRKKAGTPGRNRGEKGKKGKGKK